MSEEQKEVDTDQTGDTTTTTTTTTTTQEESSVTQGEEVAEEETVKAEETTKEETTKEETTKEETTKEETTKETSSSTKSTSKTTSKTTKGEDSKGESLKGASEEGDGASKEAKKDEPPPITKTNDKDIALYAHNAIRKMHDVPDLEWDDNLADEALKWAVHLATNDTSLEHNAPVTGYGENLYKAKGTSASAKSYQAVLLWSRECSTYDEPNYQCLSTERRITMCKYGQKTTHMRKADCSFPLGDKLPQEDILLVEYDVTHNVTLISANEMSGGKERQQYKGITSYKYNVSGYSSSTSTFTQLIWDETTHVGVGVAYREDTRTTYIVARYSPPGNHRATASYFDHVRQPTKGLPPKLPKIEDLIQPAADGEPLSNLGNLFEVLCHWCISDGEKPIEESSGVQPVQQGAKKSSPVVKQKEEPSTKQEEESSSSKK